MAAGGCPGKPRSGASHRRRAGSCARARRPRPGAGRLGHLARGGAGRCRGTARDCGGGPPTPNPCVRRRGSRRARRFEGRPGERAASFWERRPRRPRLRRTDHRPRRGRGKGDQSCQGGSDPAWTPLDGVARAGRASDRQCAVRAAMGQPSRGASSFHRNDQPRAGRPGAAEHWGSRASHRRTKCPSGRAAGRRAR